MHYKTLIQDEQIIYEIYLELAARFARKGKLKEADKTLALMRKILREERKCTTKRAERQKNAV